MPLVKFLEDLESVSYWGTHAWPVVRFTAFTLRLAVRLLQCRATAFLTSPLYTCNSMGLSWGYHPYVYKSIYLWDLLTLYSPLLNMTKWQSRLFTEIHMHNILLLVSVWTVFCCEYDYHLYFTQTFHAFYHLNGKINWTKLDVGISHLWPNYEKIFITNIICGK